MKTCKECRDGEKYDIPATAKVRHPNIDSWRNNAPPITKLVCDDHFHMLSTDHGDDLKVIKILK